MFATVDNAVAEALLRSRNNSVGMASNSARQVLDLSLLPLDTPDHTRLRSLVAPAFTTHRIRAQNDTTAAAVDRLADELACRPRSRRDPVVLGRAGAAQGLVQCTGPAGGAVRPRLHEPPMGLPRWVMGVECVNAD